MLLDSMYCTLVSPHRGMFASECPEEEGKGGYMGLGLREPRKYEGKENGAVEWNNSAKRYRSGTFPCPRNRSCLLALHQSRSRPETPQFPFSSPSNSSTTNIVTHYLELQSISKSRYFSLAQTRVVFTLCFHGTLDKSSVIHHSTPILQTPLVHPVFSTSPFAVTNEYQSQESIPPLLRRGLYPVYRIARYVLPHGSCCWTRGLSMSLAMPPNTNPTPPGFPCQGRLADAVPALFDTTVHVLKDEMAIQAAIGAVSRHLVDPATPLQDALLELASEAPAHILELVLCAAPDDAYQVLGAAILEGYERDLKRLLSSLAPGLLSRFALCYWFLMGVYCPATINAPRVTSTLQWKEVEAGTAVLQELAKLSFASVDVTGDTSNGSELPFGLKYTRSQGRRKRARREKDVSAIDLEVFNRYGASVPRTPVEVHKLTRSICHVQGRALKEYLNMFRRPEVGAAIKSIFLRPPEDGPDETEGDSNCSDAGSEDSYSSCSYDGSEDGAADAVAPPFVSPKKAVRLFDSAEGFGPWRITFEQRATRDLR